MWNSSPQLMEHIAFAGIFIIVIFSFACPPFESDPEAGVNDGESTITVASTTFTSKTLIPFLTSTRVEYFPISLYLCVKVSRGPPQLIISSVPKQFPSI